MGSCLSEQGAPAQAPAPERGVLAQAEARILARAEALAADGAPDLAVAEWAEFFRGAVEAEGADPRAAGAFAAARRADEAADAAEGAGPGTGHSQIHARLFAAVAARAAAPPGAGSLPATALAGLAAACSRTHLVSGGYYSLGGAHVLRQALSWGLVDVARVVEALILATPGDPGRRGAGALPRGFAVGEALRQGRPDAACMLVATYGASLEGPEQYQDLLDAAVGLRRLQEGWLRRVYELSPIFGIRPGTPIAM